MLATALCLLSLRIASRIECIPQEATSGFCFACASSRQQNADRTWHTIWSRRYIAPKPPSNSTYYLLTIQYYLIVNCGWRVTTCKCVLIHSRSVVSNTLVEAYILRNCCVVCSWISSKLENKVNHDSETKRSYWGIFVKQIDRKVLLG
jgi:hypothetical protein